MNPHSIHDEAGGADGRTEVRMPRGDLALLVAMAALALIAFLPTTRSIELANVSLVAWLMWFLMIAGPATGLALALRGGRD